MDDGFKRVNELKNLHEVSKYLYESGFKFHNGAWKKDEMRFYEYTSRFIVDRRRGFMLSGKDGSFKLESLIQFEKLVQELTSFSEIEWFPDVLPSMDMFHVDNEFYFNPFFNVSNHYDELIKHNTSSSIYIQLVFVDKDNINKLHVTSVYAYKKGLFYVVNKFPKAYKPNTNLLLVPEGIGPIEGLR